MLIDWFTLFKSVDTLAQFGHNELADSSIKNRTAKCITKIDFCQKAERIYLRFTNKEKE